jgi:transcriptional regulator of aromatic amino acid metabolism
LLHHWILDFNEYRIICDHKINRDRTRLHVLRNCLENANLSSQVEGVQAIRSEESVLLQFADFLTSAAAAQLNDCLSDASAKGRLVSLLESRLGRKIAPSSKSEQKFNVFEIKLGGGW